ncbi:MAG: LysR family transcriptional regulator [Myxococcota bacterium]
MNTNLNLDHVQILVTVAKTGSFSAAGRELGRAQSAISQSIAMLESAQGVLLFDRSAYRPRLTDAGRVLLSQAQLVLNSATQFQAVAAGMRDGVEAELTVAIDPLVPSEPLIDSLRRLKDNFSDLPVSFSTEGLGGSMRRLRDGSAALGICLLLPRVPDDIVAYPLLRIAMRPVVAPSHPLARLKRAVNLRDLEPYTQLVLSDPVEPAGEDYGLVSARLWRFVDLARRLDFLHAGFGWCRMPEHLIADSLRTGRLVPLVIADDTAPGEGPMIYAASRRNRALGPAGRWLLDALKARFAERARDLE